MHTYIIEGSHGSGRGDFVRRFAADMCTNPEHARKIMAVTAVDVHEFALPKDKKSLGVDVIREIGKIVLLHPVELDFVVIIIRNADSLTHSAQNAALKLLEEPPPNVYFFLLCEGTDALLPTVRSRAGIVRMQRAAEEVHSASETSNCPLFSTEVNPAAVLLYIHKLPSERAELDSTFVALIAEARNIVLVENGQGTRTVNALHVSQCIMQMREALEKNANTRNVKMNLVKLLLD